MSKTFVCLPTRNDAWIIERVLASASLWADHIIVADENSWDGTQEICKKFPKVTVVSFEPKAFNESYRRKVLLETVRQWDGQNLIFGLDSDEILSSEILDPKIRTDLEEKIQPGMSAMFQWIMLWKNAKDYRYDSLPEWSNSFKHFAYRDNRKLQFDDVHMHSSRVPETAAANAVIFKDVRVLHYAFAEWDRMMAKHAYYLALEKTMGSKVHPYILNRKYRWFYRKSSEGIVVKQVPKEWVGLYEVNNVKVTQEIIKDKFYWYDAEVLRFFKTFGPSYFKRLNIWDTNWEEKRLVAQEKGEKGIIETNIACPQSWYDRLYYKYLQTLLDQGGVADVLLGKK
ncbi:MAG: glycosyltransferase family 2 protein [Candidatus Doudnabacteria bacterium]|nr:glycosyltransferase family 2 protein [Candidatus Doudnabacteria bacterium]